MRFIQEFKLFLKIIFDDELSDLLFIILLSSYFTILLVGLILSLFTILLSEIISGLLILFSSLIYYRPFSFERKEYIDYFPSFDIIYVPVIGISIFIHGFITICKKTKRVRHLYLDEEILLNESTIGEKEPELIIDCNKVGFKNIVFFFIKNYLRKTTKNLITILDFDLSNFDIYNDYDSYKINLKYMKICVEGYKGFLNEVQIKNFIGRIRLINKQTIKFSIIDKGNIVNSTSLFKTFILKFGFFIFDEKCVNFLNEKINAFIKDGYTQTIGIYKYKIIFKTLSLFSGILRINFDLNILDN